MLHHGLVKAHGGEASKAVATLSAQNAYCTYLGDLEVRPPETAKARKLQYVWGPKPGSKRGEGKGLGRVPGDPEARMHVFRCSDTTPESVWVFSVIRSNKIIEEGYRPTKAEAVLAAEEAYIKSTPSANIKP